MKNMKLFWRMSGYFLISALFFAFGGGTLRAQDTFEKVSAATDLVAGDEVIIVADKDGTLYAFTGEVASKWGLYMTVVANNEGIITATVGTKGDDYTGPRLLVVEFDGEGNLSLRDKYTSVYLSGVSGSNTIFDTAKTAVKVELTDGGIHHVAQKVRLRFNPPTTSNTQGFRFYKDGNDGSANTTGKPTVLYKKQAATPTCDPVTNQKAQPGSTSVTLTWDGPTTEPENGYIVNISAGETAVVTDAVVAKSTHTYTHSSLTAGTEYSYSIVSACSETSKSTAVTGTFTTKEAATKSLHVTLSGTKEGSSYLAGNITFNFSVENATLGSDAQVKYYIVDGEGEEVVGGSTSDASYTYAFTTPDDYTAEFELVDNDGNAFSPVVKEEIEFTVKLPKVAAPTFTPAEQAAAFTTAQTVTLASTTEGATIYYAIGEADFAEYTSGIALNATGTYIIKAYAAKTGMANSDTLTKTYKLDLPKTVANLKALYAEAKDTKVVVSGKMVVTYKDSSTNSRVWVQDIVKENGASMLLYKVPAAEYTKLKIGDVLENVAGKVADFNQLIELELDASAKLNVAESNHAIYVDTLTVAQIKANIATVQNALVCVENVTFTPGTFGASGANRTHTLNQGDETLTFYVTTAKADFVGEATPTGMLNVTGILGNNSGTAQIYARSKADMVEVLVCEDVQTVHSEIEGTTAHFSWEVDHEPALGYIIEVRTDNEANTLVKRDTVNNPKTLTYNLEGLAEGDYTCYVMAYCGEDNVAEAVTDHFSIVAAGAPSIAIVKPAAGEFTRDSVMFTCKVTNFVLGTGEGADGSIKYTISGTNLTAPVTGTIVDTFFFYKFDRSGKDTVRVELVDKDGASLNPVKVARRAFSINLPDVAAPVFTPAAGRYADSVEVTLDCATEGAAIFYAQGEGEYVAYTTGEKIVLKESAELKAFACKDRMDTSATVRAAYTITKSVAIEGEIVFEEYFDKVANGVSQITGSLDDNTTLPGWTGDFVYQHTGGGVVRLGKSISNGAGAGWIETPAINLSENNGKFMVSFYAQAWKNDKDSIRVVVGNQSAIIEGLVNDKESNQTRITDMTHYVVTFENGTAETKIKFEPLSTTTNNRFFLDSIRVYQVLPNVPMIIAPATCTMSTIQGTPVSSEITVKGKLLSENVTVACPTGNFSVSPASLDKDEVMGEGAKLTVTFNGSVTSDNVDITLTSGELSKTIQVTATATPIVEVDNIAALRAGEQNTLYKVKGEVVVTAVDGISTWVQDATAAIQIYGNPGNTYAVGDGITGIYGTLSDYHGLIELVPGGTQPAATTHDKVMDPEVMTVEELNEKGAEYSSRLIRINDLMLGATEGNWKGSTSYTATDEAGNELVIYTTISQGSYIGEALPTGKFDLIAIAGIRDGKIQVTPRVKEDIIAGEVDPCAAPTRLKAVVVDKNATLTWEGAAEQYRVVVTLGEKEVCNELVTEKTYSLSNLEVGTYAWKVASVCEGGEEWANGDAFEVKPVANEAADGLAFRIYPNPTTGVFYVEVAEGARMEIFTLGGVMVRNEMLKAGRNEVRLDRSGIYFVRLTNANGAAVNRVIVR